MELKPGTIIEGYEITETIGKGAMSRVYGAKKDNLSYAIKETISEFSGNEEENLILNSFKREADLLFDINHTGIPKFYKRFEHNGKFYIVMEYIKGKSLEDIIKGSTEPLEEKKVLNYGIQLCEILFYLHTLSPEPVIYRDLKPANIIITEGDTVRLIDFGVARRYDPNKDCDTVRLGTPGYAAPEQCRKKGQSIPQSDIYALGVVLHQLLTLYDPSITPFKLPPIRKLNSNISEQLEWIINKAINLDLRDRYLDTGLFKDELIEYYEENFIPFRSPYSKNNPYRKDENFSTSNNSKKLIPEFSKINIGGKIAIIGFIVSAIWLFINILYVISQDPNNFCVFPPTYYDVCGGPGSLLAIIVFCIILYYISKLRF